MKAEDMKIGMKVTIEGDTTVRVIQGISCGIVGLLEDLEGSDVTGEGYNADLLTAVPE